MGSGRKRPKDRALMPTTEGGTNLFRRRYTWKHSFHSFLESLILCFASIYVYICVCVCFWYAGVMVAFHRCRCQEKRREIQKEKSQIQANQRKSYSRTNSQIFFGNVSFYFIKKTELSLVEFLSLSLSLPVFWKDVTDTVVSFSFPCFVLYFFVLKN